MKPWIDSQLTFTFSVQTGFSAYVRATYVQRKTKPFLC